MFNYFPCELSKEYNTVISVLFKKTFNSRPDWFSNEKVEYRLASGTVSVPYRVYLLEPAESEILEFTDLQKQILYCLYTRSSNGYLREKYIRKLLESDLEEWCVPYIVKLCDEYVVEILEVIYNSLKSRCNEDIKAFCAANRRTIQKNYSRMVSYWNEYYRTENPNLKQYVGRKLFRECLGYNASFEAAKENEG